jgi:alcohol dehydrogenase (NADP+)
MQAKGLCKHIGVSNFSIPKLKELIAVAKNKPEMNQVEMHPYLQQNELFQFCQSEGIYLTAYSPLGRNLPIKNKPGLTNEPIIINLAKKYNCTPAQIIIAWGVQRGIVIIPKSVHPERIKENIKSLDINISPEDMTKIATLDSHTRMTDGSAWIFPNGPYTMKNIWDEK